MNANCPIGKYNCAWCNYLTTTGCSYIQTQQSITISSSTDFFEKRRAEYKERFDMLMKCEKSMLVKMIIGEEQDYVMPTTIY